MSAYIRKHVQAEELDEFCQDAFFDFQNSGCEQLLTFKAKKGRAYLFGIHNVAAKGLAPKSFNLRY